MTKSKMDSAWKSRYYTIILRGEKDHGLWSVSTAKYFVSSLHQRGMQVSLFASVSVRTRWIPCAFWAKT